MLRIIPVCLIRLYWLVVPESKRRQCLFRESCSNAVYAAAKREGIVEALRVFLYRIKACNSKTKIFVNPITGDTNLLLTNGECVDEAEINPRLIRHQE